MRFYFKALLSACLFICAALTVLAANDVQCFFTSGSSCPVGSAKLIGVKNDTGGFQNAHVQNRTINSHPYSLCCNNSNGGITIGNGCDEATVIKLSSEDNAHVEIGSNSNYGVSACLSSDWQTLSCTYEVGSCSSGACILSMAGSEGINTTNAHIGNCSMYSQKVCCGLLNNAPTKPVLTLPVNGNVTVFERKPDFVWEASTDPDGDSILYSLNITCTPTSSCPCDPVDVGGISTLSYTIFSSLCVDISYNWSVTACDNYLLCNTSAIWNFTIDSIALIDVIVNSTSFGDATPGVSNDTTDSSPPPLVIRNIGNVLVNITINATQFFTSAALNTANYRFSVADNETGSINTSCSQTTFANMQATPANAVCDLNYSDSNDETKIHLGVLVPNDEPPGTKRSDIQFIPIPTEGS